MAGPKDKSFAERREAAKDAKKALISHFRARPAKDDPAVVEREAQRLSTSKAREERAKARAAARKAEAEVAAQRAQEEAERAAAERRAEADRAVSLLAEQKAARDARYAARKARRR